MKKIKISRTKGRKGGVSLADILTAQVAYHRNRRKDFKTFYCEISGEYLRMFLPKIPPCSAMLKQIKKFEPISDSI